MPSDLKVDIFSSTENPIMTMWLAARNCYYRNSFEELEKKFVHNEAVDFLKRIYDKNHLSIFEFANFNFKVQNLSRSCLAQLTRHRIGFSFAVQSQHYQKHDNFDFKELEKYYSEDHRQKYFALMKSINDFYIDSLNNGIPKFIAREVLPNACLVHLMMSTNLRSLDNFWKLRKTNNNTPEIILLSDKLYNSVNEKIPDLHKIISYHD